MTVSFNYGGCIGRLHLKENNLAGKAAFIASIRECGCFQLLIVSGDTVDGPIIRDGELVMGINTAHDVGRTYIIVCMRGGTKAVGRVVCRV